MSALSETQCWSTISWVMFYWCFFVHSVFLPENSRKKHKLYKTQHDAADGLFCVFPTPTCFLSFTFLLHKSSKQSSRQVGPARLPRAAICFKRSAWVELKVSFWYPGREPQLGPTSHSPDATLRETRVSFEVSLTAFYRLGVFSGPSFPLCL